MYQRTIDGRIQFLRPVSLAEICQVAEESLADQYIRSGQVTGPDQLKELIRLRIGHEPNECFVAMFLDSRHRIIATETLFQGTIDGAQVAPRVILQRALHHSCAALCVAHNHPSGVTEPSLADRGITRRIQEALAYIDVKLLDHIIVGADPPFSFAEARLL